jgi:hypothetical protein
MFMVKNQERWPNPMVQVRRQGQDVVYVKLEYLVKVKIQIGLFSIKMKL